MPNPERLAAHVLDRITEALCAAAVNLAHEGNAPTQLKVLREALVKELSAVHAVTPAASPSKKRKVRRTAG